MKNILKYVASTKLFALRRKLYKSKLKKKNTVNIIFYCLPDILYVWLAIIYQVRSFTALLATACVANGKPVPFDHQPSRTAVRNSLDQLARRDESFAACQLETYAVQHACALRQAKGSFSFIAVTPNGSDQVVRVVKSVNCAFNIRVT